MADYSSTALTGLDAASYELAIDSNNIANVNTLGYKTQDTNFYELYSGTGGNGPGSGVTSSGVGYSFAQGNTIQTGLNTDMMISGSGFFSLTDPGTGQTFYSRSGAFSLNPNGYLVNKQGYQLQGYLGTTQSGSTSPLQISQEAMSPTASANVTFQGNINKANNDGASQTVTFYDAQGSAHSLVINFAYDTTNSTATSAAWDLSYSVDGGASTALAVPTLTYNSAGKITAGGTQTVNTGIGATTLSVNFASLTGYGGSTLSGPTGTADGCAAGSYSGFSVKNGVVTANYTNGKTTQVGSVALSSFFVNSGLQDAGNNNWIATQNVGTITTGVSGSFGLGSVSSGALEGSNVNLSSQVVDMISAQRNFQSNAQVLKTGKILDQTILSIDS
jgi:flagellar hook protein FlgE